MPVHPLSSVRRPAALALSVCAALALAACTAQAGQEGIAAEADATATPAGQVTGEAVSCIQTSRIRNTVVHNDETIDFEMAGGPTYRNTMPNRCPSLGFEERFSYQTSIGQLCSTDIITVLYSDGTRGPGCGLGEFLPIELNEVADQPAN